MHIARKKSARVVIQKTQDLAILRTAHICSALSASSVFNRQVPWPNSDAQFVEFGPITVIPNRVFTMGSLCLTMERPLSTPSSLLCTAMLRNIRIRIKGKAYMRYLHFILALTFISSIIFTAWRDTITVISSLFTATNISHRIVEGSMSIPDRKKSLENFQSDPSCRVLLMTFGTGSTGLVALHHLFIILR